MKKRIYLFMVLFCFVFALMGCNNSESKEGTELVIIVGRHANANLYTEDMISNVENLIMDSFSYWQDSSTKKYCARANISVIVSDGNPTIFPITINGSSNVNEILYTETNTTQKRDKNIKEIVDNIKLFLRSDDLCADDEEVDLLAAISEAQTILDASSLEQKHVLILDTGITTSGFLDMRTIDIRTGTVEEIINDKIPSKAFPLFNDEVKGTFLGLGNVASPQSILRNDNEFKTRLKELWTGILEKCNVKLEEEIHFAASEGDSMMWYEDESGYPYVGVVLFEMDKLKVEDEENLPSVDNPIVHPTKPWDIKAAALGFKGDSAEFKNELVAKELIKGYALEIIEYLNSYPEEKIYVCGSIAKVTPDKDCESHTLSEARAQKVADILINDFGIPKERIIVIDAGTTKFSWRNNEEFPNGTLNRENQQNNRVVEIIPESCVSEIEELRSAGYID